MQQNKYEPSSSKNTEANVNSKYTQKNYDNYTPSTPVPVYTTKYPKTEPSYRTSSKPSYPSTQKPVVVTLSQSYAPEPERSYVGVKVKTLPKPLYGKIEPYEPEKEYETYVPQKEPQIYYEEDKNDQKINNYETKSTQESHTTYSKEPSPYSNEYQNLELQKYGFSYVGNEEPKQTKQFTYKVEKPQYAEVPSHYDEAKPSYIKVEEPKYEKKPIYKPRKPKHASGYRPVPVSYHKPSVEYHEHNLPAEIDIGHGYKLKLVYKPKKSKTYPTQYAHTSKPSSSIYKSSHGPTYSVENHSPTYETTHDYSDYKPYKQQKEYPEEIRYHESQKYHPTTEKTSHHSQNSYTPHNDYHQSEHFNKFESHHFKQYSFKDAPRKYTFEFLKPGEGLNLSPRKNEDARDGRVLESDIETTTPENLETTTAREGRNLVEDITSIINRSITTALTNQGEDETTITTTEPLQTTTTTSVPSTTTSEEADTTTTSVEDVMTTTSIVELQPRVQSETETTTETEVNTTTETITSTMTEDVTTTEPATDVPRFKRKSFGYSWYLEG